MWCVIDNGGEPGNWSVNLVSSQVGVESARGVVAGDGFLIIINRNGLYLFQGGQPTKISTEIDGTWRASAFGASAFGIVDSERQQFLGFPVTGSSSDKATYCDFFEGLSTAGTYSQGHGRKYANWTVPTISGVTHGSLIVRASGVRDVMIGKKTTTSNDCLNSETGVLSASGAFPMAGWVNEAGNIPTAVTSGLADPLGTSNAWQWAEDNTTHTRIVCGKTSSASHAFGAVWLRSTGASFTATIGIRVYNGTTDSDPYTDWATRTITVTSEWQRFPCTSVVIGHNTVSTLPSGRRCLVLTYTGPVTLQMYGHQVISASPWDTGYVRTTGATVTSQPSSLIQALSRTRPATYTDPITSATTFTNLPEYTYDSDGTILSFYVGAPVGRGRERGAFLGCSQKVWGLGSITNTIYKLYPRGATIAATRTLAIDAAEDVEVLYGPAVASAGLVINSWQLNWSIGPQADPLGYWNLSSINIYEKLSTAPQRGT